MQPGDYDEVLGLWQRYEGVGLSPSDQRMPSRSSTPQTAAKRVAETEIDAADLALVSSEGGRRGARNRRRRMLWPLAIRQAIAGVDIAKPSHEGSMPRAPQSLADATRGAVLIPS